MSDSVDTIFEIMNPPLMHEHVPNSINDFKRQSLLINQFSHSGPCLIKGDVNNDGKEDVFVGGSKGQAAAIFVQSSKGSFSKRVVTDFEIDKLIPRCGRYLLGY